MVLDDGRERTVKIAVFRVLTKDDLGRPRECLMIPTDTPREHETLSPDMPADGDYMTCYVPTERLLDPLEG